MTDPNETHPEAQGFGWGRRRHLAAMLLLLTLVGLSFANTLAGAFVYDDVKQIVGNHLIWEPGRLGEALSSDVWAFKGQREAAWSNYWRPTFVLWLAANARLFGVDNATGWHFTLVLLHGLVCCWVFVLLGRLKVRFWPSLAAAALFAVHPVHVESVAWISGVPDPLMSFFFVGSLLLALPVSGAPSKLAEAGSLGLFALALGAKEVAVVLPLVLFAFRWRRTSSRRDAGSALQAAGASLPFLALVGVFLAARWAVLGQVQIETPWHRSLGEALLTVPSLLVFYLRQSVFPLWLGPSYPLRAVTTDGLSGSAFWGPLFLLLMVLGGWLWAARGRRGVMAGGLLFALPLLPALNINAYIEEQLVHDRYLYLPLLGILLALVSLVPASTGKRRSLLWVGTIVAVLLLGFQTLRYNRAWTSELALWSRGVEADPSSAFNRSQLGYALLALERRPEALEAFDQALEILPVTAALLGRAGIARDSGRLTDAEDDLRLVLEAPEPR